MSRKVDFIGLLRRSSLGPNYEERGTTVSKPCSSVNISGGKWTDVGDTSVLVIKGNEIRKKMWDQSVLNSEFCKESILRPNSIVLKRSPQSLRTC